MSIDNLKLESSFDGSHSIKGGCLPVQVRMQRGGSNGGGGGGTGCTQVSKQMEEKSFHLMYKKLCNEMEVI